MRYTELLASYLPSVIVEEIVAENEEQLPRRTEYESPVLFADLSGFTALSENMSNRFGSTVGSEKLAHKINSIFSQIVKIVSSEGGDVYKFAGDAMIVLWASSDEDSETKVRRCVQSAKRVQELFETDGEQELSVKIGLGVGPISILHLGGVLGRTETVSVGEPLHQAFQAEQRATSGEIVMSGRFYFIAEDFVKVRKVPSTSSPPFYYLESTLETLRKRNKFALKKDLDSLSSAHELAIRRMIPAAAIESIDPNHPEFEQFSNEVRRVSVVFLSLGFPGDELEDAAKDINVVNRLHKAVRVVQTALYRLEGSLNKFLVDDKGCTIIAVFGLPPFSHENDPKRAVTFALHVTEALESELSLSCSIGITSGTAFCGVIGSQTRKEYSILGDIVNLSARLMQASKLSGPGQIFVDEPTYHNSSRDVKFRTVGKLSVKGKSKEVPTFQPLVLFEDEPNVGSKSSSQSGSLNFENFTAQRNSAHFRERFNTIDIITTKRVSTVQGKGGSKAQTNDALSVYFKGSSTTRGRTPTRQAAASSISDSLSPERGVTSPKAAAEKAAKKTSSFFFGSTSSRGSTKRSSASRLSQRLSSMLSSKTRGSKTESQPEFEFGMTEVQSPTNKRRSARSSAAGELDDHSETSSRGDKDLPTPRSTKRESLVLYNHIGDVQKRLLTTQKLAELEVLEQAAVGSHGLLFVATVRRHDAESSINLIAAAVAHAQRDGLINSSVSIDDLALLIQGTEFCIPLHLFQTTSEYLNHRKPGGTQGSAKLPLKYLESIVNEALAHGEIRNEPSNIQNLRASAASSNSRSFWNNSKHPKKHGHQDRHPEPYIDYSGNGGTVLKLVLVPVNDLKIIQSSASFIMQTLIQRKIELLEFKRGSVTVLSGDPGSGKTSLLKRFVFGFLSGAVPVYCSSDRWSVRSAGHKFDWELEEEEEAHGKSKSFRNTEENFSLWLDIINRWLDFELFGTTSRDKSSDSDNEVKLRMKLLKDTVDHTLHPYLALINAELGVKFLDPLGAAAQALSNGSAQDQKSHINEMICSVIVDIVCKIVQSLGSLMIVFDDCLRVDAQSWKVASSLTKRISSEELPLMLVFCSRPFEGLVDRSLGLSPNLIPIRSREALDEYRNLCRLHNVQYSRLGRMSDYMAHDLFRKSVGENIQSVAPELWQICEARCFNNPLLIKEFAFELRNARRPKLVKYMPIENKKGSKKKGFDANLKYVATLAVSVQEIDEPAWSVHAAHKAAMSRQAVQLNANTAASFDAELELEDSPNAPSFSADMYPPSAVPPPATAAGVLAARVDRLPQMEQVVLKIACVIGSVFSLRLVENVYPFQNDEARAEVKVACESLADQHGIFHKIRASAYNDEYVYKFADVLLVSAVRHRLLQKQKLSLASKITRARAQYKAALNLSDLQRQDNSLPIFQPSRLSVNNPGSIAPSNKSLLEGFVLVKKRGDESRKLFSDWKERYVVLREDSILIFKKKDPKKNSDADCTEAIYLNDASVRSLEFPEAKDRANLSGGKDPCLVFLVESADWSRKTERSFTPRSFTFAAASKSEAQSWLSRIRMVVNKLKLGALLAGPRANGRTPSTKATNSTRLAISTRLLPVRRRDPTLRLRRDESVLVLKLESAKRPDVDKKSDTAMDWFPEIYASARLKLAGSSQIVRKQTMLSGPTNAPSVVFGDLFAFVLLPETLVNWVSLGFSEQKNAQLEVVLWKQKDGALGFDRMIGVCTIPLESLFKSFLKKPKGSSTTIKTDMNFSWPYRPGKITSTESPLQISLKLNLCKDDLDLLRQFRTATKGGKVDHQWKPHAQVGREVYTMNHDFAIYNERAQLHRLRNTSASSFFDDDRGSVSAFEEDSSIIIPEGSSERTASQEEKNRATSLVENGSNGRDRWGSFGQAKQKRSSTPAETTSLGGGNSPIDAALSHLEYLISSSMTDKRRVGELDNLKQLLLTRSFNSLVDHVKLDEDSKLWLSTFTRPAPSDDTATKRKKGFPSRSRADTADSVEKFSDLYLEEVGRQMSYRDETGAIRGPHSVSFFTNRIMKRQIKDTVLVFVHSLSKDGSENVEDDDFSEDDMIPLKERLSQLEGFASQATRAASLHKAKSVRRSRLAMALSDLGRAHRVNKESFPSCYQSKSMMTMSFANLESVWSRWALRERKQKAVDPHSLDIGSWNFNLSLVDINLFGPMFAAMLCNLGLDQEFSIPSSAVYSFVEAVNEAMTMHKNAYHNMNHAIDVAQAAYCILGRMGAADILTQAESLGVMIASMCHDMEHPGLNNAYQIRAKTDLALRYDRAPLESHHVACCFALLRQQNCNLLVNCTESDVERIRVVIMDSILATDMQSHFGLVDQLRNLVVRTSDNLEGGASDPLEDQLEHTLLDPGDRLTIVKTIVHYADISNPSRAWKVSQRWQSLVVEEFFAQGDRERANGWEISPGMDREITKQQDMALSFIDFIVAPAAVSLVGLLPESAEICYNLAENRVRWAEIQQKDAMQREDFSESDRKEAITQQNVRRAAFDEILSSAGFQHSLDGSIKYAPNRSTKRRGSLFGLEALSARQSLSV